MKIKNSLILASLASLTVSANAAVILGDTVAVDFGLTATSTLNYNISSSASPTVANLVRLSNGTATGVALTVAGFTSDNINGISGNGGNTLDPDIFFDGSFSNNGPVTLTFSGLNDNFTYDLVGGTARGPNQNNLQNFQSDWSIPGAATQNSGALAADGYVNFTGLTSSGGNLVVTVTAVGANAIISQLELTAVSEVVPEPSSTALLGLAGCALLMRRRK